MEGTSCYVLLVLKFKNLHTQKNDILLVCKLRKMFLSIRFDL